MLIPFNILDRFYKKYRKELEAKALNILRNCDYILSKEVNNFEKEFAEFVGCKYCVGVASGLDALWISIKNLGIAENDEIIVPANTYIASILGISLAGATPILVEPDIYNNIDTNKIEEKITKNTKAILPVHLYGQACNMEKILYLANKYNLKIIEDCAQSHGATFNGQMTGSFGNVGCFSFYPTKNLGAFGDGGAIVTNDADLAEKIRTFRNYGSKIKYHNEMLGANSRLDELQAGLLRVKLKHLMDFNNEKTRIAIKYLTQIKNPLIELPLVRKGSTSIWHLFTIKTQKRDTFINYLKDANIFTNIHYPIPPHLSSAYNYLNFSKGDFPITEDYANSIVSLPSYYGMTLKEQDYVIDVINKFNY